jgi:hypothetical protein
MSRIDQRVAGATCRTAPRRSCALTSEDVARGAGHDRGEQRLVVVVRREDEGLIAGSTARTSRHLDPDRRAVEYGDVHSTQECAVASDES